MKEITLIQKICWFIDCQRERPTSCIDRRWTQARRRRLGIDARVQCGDRLRVGILAYTDPVCDELIGGSSGIGHEKHR